jgi:hypothetical protein
MLNQNEKKENLNNILFSFSTKKLFIIANSFAKRKIYHLAIPVV